MEKISGIYIIRSTCNLRRVYVGSAKNISIRWSLHRRDLAKGRHHSIKLQRHYDKYGAEDLIYEMLELCPIEALINREQYYIDKLRPYFNICKIAGSSLGVRRSRKTRDKLRATHLGKPTHGWSDESRAAMALSMVGNVNGIGNTGKVRSDDSKQKYREATLAFFDTPAGQMQRELNRERASGVKQSEETIKKRMIKLREMSQTPEYREKKSLAAKAQPPRVCEHCGKLCIFPDYYIHHGKKCKKAQNT